MTPSANSEPQQNLNPTVRATPMSTPWPCISSGRINELITILKENLARHQEDRDILSALVTFSRDSGNIGAALEYAERLSASSRMTVN